MANERRQSISTPSDARFRQRRPDQTPEDLLSAVRLLPEAGKDGST